MRAQTEHQYLGKPRHRFLAFDRREIDDQPVFVYRCICGYLEAVPVAGGPYLTLDHRFKPRPDARRMVLHLNLERAHELN